MAEIRRCEMCDVKLQKNQIGILCPTCEKTLGKYEERVERIEKNSFELKEDKGNKTFLDKMSRLLDEED